MHWVGLCWGCIKKHHLSPSSSSQIILHFAVGGLSYFISLHAVFARIYIHINWFPEKKKTVIVNCSPSCSTLFHCSPPPSVNQLFMEDFSSLSSPLHIRGAGDGGAARNVIGVTMMRREWFHFLPPRHHSPFLFLHIIPTSNLSFT